MNRTIGLGMAAVALLAVTGCKQAGTSEGTADTAAIEKQLKEIETQWNKDYAARDGAALAAHYAEGAALANPGEDLIQGDGIRPMLDKFVSDPNLKLEFASDRVQVAKSGDLAYTRGHFTMQTSDLATKQPRTDKGYYLTVWQKQADGSWKAVEDFITPGAPTVPATAATTEDQ